jgi:hypothetical protein
MTRFRERLNAACRVACRASDPAQKERDAMHCGPMRLASPPSLPPREFRDANEDSKRTEPNDPGPANSRMRATATCRSVRATKVARLRLVPADRTSANLACLPATGEVRLTVLAEPPTGTEASKEGSSSPTPNDRREMMERASIQDCLDTTGGIMTAPIKPTPRCCASAPWRKRPNGARRTASTPSYAASTRSRRSKNGSGSNVARSGNPGLRRVRSEDNGHRRFPTSKRFPTA